MCHLDALNCCCFKAMDVSGSSRFVYIRFSTKRDACVGALGRLRGATERVRSVLIAAVTRVDMSFVRYEKKLSYCRKLNALLGDVNGL